MDDSQEATGLEPGTIVSLDECMTDCTSRRGYYIRWWRDIGTIARLNHPYHYTPGSQTLAQRPLQWPHASARTCNHECHDAACR